MIKSLLIGLALGAVQRLLLPESDQVLALWPLIAGIAASAIGGALSGAGAKKSAREAQSRNWQNYQNYLKQTENAYLESLGGGQHPGYAYTPLYMTSPFGTGSAEEWLAGEGRETMAATNELFGTPEGRGKLVSSMEPLGAAAGAGTAAIGQLMSGAELEKRKSWLEPAFKAGREMVSAKQGSLAQNLQDLKARASAGAARQGFSGAASARDVALMRASAPIWQELAGLGPAQALSEANAIRALQEEDITRRLNMAGQLGQYTNALLAARMAPATALNAAYSAQMAPITPWMSKRQPFNVPAPPNIQAVPNNMQAWGAGLSAAGSGLAQYGMNQQLLNAWRPQTVQTPAYMPASVPQLQPSPIYNTTMSLGGF